MRKILLFGACAFLSASAFAALEAPSITPPDGSVFYGMSQDATLEWEGILSPAAEQLTVELTCPDEKIIEIPAEFWVMGDYDEELEQFVETGPSQMAIQWGMYTLTENFAPIPGEYVITIPADLVKNADGEGNEEIVLNYTYYGTKAEDSIEPDPFEDWDKVFYADELAAVTITFPSEIEINEPQMNIICELQAQGPVGPLADFVNGILDPDLVKVEDNQIILDLSGLTEGDWNIEIPAGFAKYTELDGYYTSVVQATFKVGEGSSSDFLGNAEVVFGPKNYDTYSTENFPPYMIVSWNFNPIELHTDAADVSISVYEKYNYDTVEFILPEEALSLAYLNPEDVEDEPNIDDPDIPVPELLSNEAFNALKIDFASYLPEDIEYPILLSIRIPAGLVSSDGKENLAQEFQFDIYSVSDLEAIYELDTTTGVLSVTWGEDVTVDVTYYANDEGYAAYITDMDGEVIKELEYTSVFDLPDYMDPSDFEVTNYMVDWDYVGLLIDLANLGLEDGKYRVWLPTGYVTINDVDYQWAEFNAATYFDFSLKDGVVSEETTAIKTVGEAINAAEGVYNLLGVKVANSLEGLAKGIYIVNGKKVLVNK